MLFFLPKLKRLMHNDSAINMIKVIRLYVLFRVILIPNTKTAQLKKPGQEIKIKNVFLVFALTHSCEYSYFILYMCSSILSLF